jgi:hypothetical protein
MISRNHPVRQLLDWLNDGGALSDEDLAELDLPADVDRDAVEQLVRSTAATIGEHRRAGRRDLARLATREASAEISTLLQPDEDHDDFDVLTVVAKIPRS